MHFPSAARRGLLAAAPLLLLAACGRDDLPTVPSMDGPSFDVVTPDILVSSTADDGPGTLRQAIRDVPDGGVIGFEPALSGGTIKLATVLFIEEKSITIEGPADHGITLDGDGVTRLIHIFSDAGLTLRYVTLTGSHGTIGAILSAGPLRIEHSTLTGNHSVEEGASGDGYGGAVFHAGGNITIVNSTLSGNVADQRGGAIASVASSGSITLIHTTVTGNSAPDGVAGAVYIGETAVDFALQNSLIAGNSAPTGPNCVSDAGDTPRLGTNLLGDAGCVPDAEDIVAADPGVGPLADNGGPTRTHALLPGSPAIETAVQACGSVTTDQRLVARPQGTYCDIGAFEFAGFVTPPLAIDAGGTVNSATGTAIVSGTISCPAPATLTLRVTLRQSQRLGRTTATVEATKDVPVACGGLQPWSAALVAATGGFRSGNGAVTARTVDGPVYLRSAEASRVVKLAWARK